MRPWLDCRPQPDLFYYNAGRLRALRRGPWKLHFTGEKGEAAELYQVETDIGERFNVAAAHPDIVADMRGAIEHHQASFEQAPSQR